VTAVESARAGVERLSGFERDLGNKWRAAYARLVELQELSGDELLAATEAGRGDEALTEIAGQMARAQSEIEAYVRAIVAARSRRRAAILQTWKTEAGDLRSQAEELRAEAADRQKKTADLLEKLQAWEGVAYVVGPPIPVTGTRFDPPQTPLTQQHWGRAGLRLAKLEAPGARQPKPVSEAIKAFHASVGGLALATRTKYQRVLRYLEALAIKRGLRSMDEIGVEDNRHDEVGFRGTKLVHARKATDKCFELNRLGWWPGTELNRRRQPFQGLRRPSLSA
jgi:hypothetical protein